jgi:hypothetical protein
MKLQNCFFVVQNRVEVVIQKDRNTEGETTLMGRVKREDNYETNEKVD